MTTPISINALLSLPESFNEELKEGEIYTVTKSGFRITPFKMPMEISTHDHKYLGKVVVTNLNISEEFTEITFKVVKLFSEEEAKVFTDNFVRD